jgi:hypothetical protein
MNQINAEKGRKIEGRKIKDGGFDGVVLARPFTNLHYSPPPPRWMFLPVIFLPLISKS